MATVTVDPNAGTANGSKALDTTVERGDVAYGYITKDKDGKPLEKKKPAVISVEEAEDLEKVNGFEGNVITTSITYPTSWPAFLKFVEEPQTDDDGKPRSQDVVRDEAVKLFITGSRTKVTNRRNAMLLKRDEKGEFTFSDSDLTNGVLDLTKEILSGSKRVFLTEEEKTWRNLANLPEQIRKQMYDVYLQSIGKEAGNYPASE